MKKKSIYLFACLCIASLWACSSSETPAPPTRDLLKGQWTETKTTTNVKITKGLSPLFQSQFGNLTLDTFKVIRTLNFIDDKKVDIGVSSNGQITKVAAEWSLSEVGGVKTISYTNLPNLTVFNGQGQIKTDIQSISTTNLTLRTKQQLKDFPLNNTPIGNLVIDADLDIVIEMKK